MHIKVSVVVETFCACLKNWNIMHLNPLKAWYKKFHYPLFTYTGSEYVVYIYLAQIFILKGSAYFYNCKTFLRYKTNVFLFKHIATSYGMAVIFS